MINLNGKVMILTGASSPQGEAIARQLVDAGATVVLGYHRSFDQVEQLMQALEPLDGLGVPYSVDVASRFSVDAMVGETLARFGRIDGLIHAANATIERLPYLQQTWDDYNSQFRVIVEGAFNCCQSVLEDMVLRREGKILLLLTSLLERPVSGYSAYTTAVGGLRAMARDLANEVGELGIQVNSISPGFTLTGNTPHAPLHVQEALAHQTPLRRLAVPEDIGRAALFFMSDLSAFVTGEELTVDGGYSFGYVGPAG